MIYKIEIIDMNLKKTRLITKYIKISFDRMYFVRLDGKMTASIILLINFNLIFTKNGIHIRCREVALLRYTEGLNLGFKAGIQLQNKNHIEDWALGCHPHDNGHVSH